METVAENKVVTVGFREALKNLCSRKDFSRNLQNIHTPFDFCHEIIDKLERYTSIFDKTFLVIGNVEFVEVLCEDFGIIKEKIWFVTDCVEKGKVVKGHPRYKGVNVTVIDFVEFLTSEMAMKFDVIVMNPPYQSKSDAENTKTQAIWDKFVQTAISICKDDGRLCVVHPSGWRGCGTAFSCAKTIKEKQIEYLEIHSEQDGLKTFGATTRYDWYILKNCGVSHPTPVVDQDGKNAEVDMRKVSFIPNSQIAKIFSFLAKNGENKVEIIHSFSAYESRKDHVSDTKKEKFVHPVVYSTPVEGPTIWYSNTTENGHFGVSKVILNPCRPIGFVIDEKGEYGMSQFCAGIVGDSEYLQMVANVIKNQKTNGFAEFMETCHFTDKIFNKDVISLFRRDFWKEFLEK